MISEKGLFGPIIHEVKVILSLCETQVRLILKYSMQFWWLHLYSGLEVSRELR